MKRFFSLCLLLALVSVAANAEVKDTLNTNIQEYSNELGYFQRANRDMNDPRFMFLDSKSRMEFGIGGAVRISGYYAFAGEVNSRSFAPSLITMPDDTAPYFGTKISSSEVHFKARYKWNGKKTGKQHAIIAYVEMGGNDENMLQLNRVYISFDGFSAGKLPSFFDDIEVGVLTTGISDNSLVDNDLPLFGYTHRFKSGWEVAASLEKTELDLAYLSDGFSYLNKVVPARFPSSYAEVQSDYIPMPDVALHGKYRWRGGHVQLAGIFKNMSYWCRRADSDFGITRTAFGWGLSLTGSFRPLHSDRLALNFECVGGCGIANYMPDYTKANYMVGIKDGYRDGYRELSAAPVLAVQTAAQYKWNSFLQSNFIFSYRKYFREKSNTYWFDHYTANMGEISGTYFALANLVWNIGDYAHLAVEYMFGAKQMYKSPDYYNMHPDQAFHDMFDEWGFANRLAVELAFYF